MNVLIIEDEAFSAMVTVAFFKDAGHTVTHASSSEEAIASLNVSVPDVVVSDWTIEGELSAVEVAKRIRAVNPNAKLAFVTGHQQEDLKSELLDVGPYSFYTKPVDFEKLVAEMSC